jgi:adenine-specific DNA-methyltransferase
MIYIDPPYNKDKDFVYPDRWSEGIKSYKEFCGFVDNEGNITTSVDEAKNATGRKHSRWLTMMYPRLFLARNLLSDDGVIFVSIDDDEVANLKKIMDEIFGEENFVASLIWQKKTGAADSIHFSEVTEYALVYAKKYDALNLTQNSEAHDEKRFRFTDEYIKERGPFYYDNLDRGTLGYIESLDYGVETPDGKLAFPNGRTTQLNDGWRWKWGKDKFEWGKKNGFIELKQSKDKECGWSVYYKIYMNVDNEGINITRSSPFKNLIQGILNTHASNESKELFNTSNLFSNPKPTKLIKFFINLTVDKSAIILDFFAGSGTTAHAVMSLNAEDGGNRKYICVQIPEPTPENSEAKKAGYKTIAEITKERIRRAGEKVKADNPLFAGDIGFKVFKLDESNFKQWDKEVADAEALKQQIMEFADNVSPEASKANMLYELLLKKGYSLNAKVAKKQIADNEIFVVDGSMLVCLDDKISIATIDEVIKLRPAHFIVLDRAFEGNDQLKTNTWQTFKSLFPNDENPFETV